MARGKGKRRRKARRKARAREIKKRYAGTPFNRKWGSYDAYLKSPEWKELRRRVISRFDKTCQACGKVIIFTNDRHVHHLTYERIGKEDIKDLVLLCRPCHEKEHNGKRFQARLSLDQAV